eukprot:6059237-Amphidinium_carterae.3
MSLLQCNSRLGGRIVGIRALTCAHRRPHASLSRATLGMLSVGAQTDACCEHSNSSVMRHAQKGSSSTVMGLVSLTRIEARKSHQSLACSDRSRSEYPNQIHLAIVAKSWYNLRLHWSAHVKRIHLEGWRCNRFATLTRAPPPQQLELNSNVSVAAKTTLWQQLDPRTYSLHAYIEAGRVDPSLFC